MKQAERFYGQGQFLVSEGKLEEATLNFERSLLLSRKAEYKPGIVFNLNEMAIIHTAKGDVKKARELLSEALAISKELNMAPEVSKAMDNIAKTYWKEGNYGEALNHYQELLQWDRKTGNELGEGISLYYMGIIYERHLHQPEEAREYYLQALTIFEKLGKEKYIKAVKKRIGMD